MCRQWGLCVPVDVCCSLGVYSVSKDPSYGVLPNDPLCVAALLSLLKATKGKLSAGDNSTGKGHSSKSFMKVLSYQAALDDQLPILIEDSKDRVNHVVKRKCQHTKMIHSLTRCKMELLQDQLTYDYIDLILFDYFTVTILEGLSDTQILEYYSLWNHNFTDFTRSLAPVSRYISNNVVSHLLKRNDFHLRNPAVATYYACSVRTKAVNLAYTSQREVITEKAASLLHELDTLFKSQKYWSSADSANISDIDILIASYTYSFSIMNNQAGLFNSVLSSRPCLAKHSKTVLSSFV